MTTEQHYNSLHKPASMMHNIAIYKVIMCCDRSIVVYNNDNYNWGDDILSFSYNYHCYYVKNDLDLDECTVQNAIG